MTRSDNSTSSRRETSETTDLSPLADEHLDEPEVSPEFVKALAAFDDALIQGKAEEPTSSDDLDRLGEEIENAKKCVLLLEEFWRRSPHSPSAEPPTQPSSASPEGTWHGDSESPSEGLRLFGRFAILGELGRGGGGIVYHAVDTKLKREVALKVPRPEFVFTDEMRRRFLVEAQAAAGMEHPNIVQVFETGLVGPISYITSALCVGPTLASWLDQNPAPIRGDVAAALMAKLAEAVDHAHRHGIVHRDLKPGNILLESHDSKVDPQGDAEGISEGSWLGFVPKISDFGLARFVDQQKSKTRSGTVLGTPAYMAPEQAEGNLEAIGPATDVFALGAILYELLTGVTPFQGTSDLQTLKRVATDDARPLRQVSPNVSRDLEAICMKCLERDPTRRYRHACELASDLRRYLAGKPTLARPVGLGKKAWMLAKRHILTLTLVTVATFSILATIVGAQWFSTRLQKAENALTQFGQHALERGRHAKYAENIRAAYRAWKMAEIPLAVEQLSRCIPSKGQHDLRGFEWYFVRRLCDGGTHTLRGPDTRIYDAAYCPLGNRIATCDASGCVWIWDPVSGKSVGNFKAHSDEIYEIDFSPSGELICTAGADGLIKFWKTHTHRHVNQLSGHSAAVACSVFSPDGQTLATAGDDRKIMIWNVQNCARILTIDAHADVIHSLVFSADGKWLASGSSDGTAKVWNVTQNYALHRTFEPKIQIRAIAFSPNSRRLVTGGDQLQVWDLAGERQCVTLHGSRYVIRSIDFSPDGQYLVAASNTTIRVWNVETQAVEYAYRGHTAHIYSVSYSPSGDSLVSTSKDGTIRLWDPTRPQYRRTLPLEMGNNPGRIAFSPDGRWLAVASRQTGDLCIRLWDLKLGVEGRELRLPSSNNKDHPIGQMSFSPDGRYLATPELDRRSVSIWDISSSTISSHVTGGVVHSCEYSPNGLTLLVVGADSVRLMDARTGHIIARLPGQRTAVFSPDGRWVVMESDHQTFAVDVWDLQAGASKALLRGHVGSISCIAFSRDGRLLATGSHTGTAKLWKVSTGTERFQSLPADLRLVRFAAFSPLGQSLLTCGTTSDGSAKFWNTETGHLMLSLDVSSGGVSDLRFSPDGLTLATSSYHKGNGAWQVELWDASPLSRIGGE